MTLALRQRTFRDAMVNEPIQLAISQPHQVLISSISVSLMAIFFASSGAVPAAAAWVGAVGVEYAYLKGLSDAAYARSAWGLRLIWAAFAIIVIAGISVLLRDAYHVAWMIAPPSWLATILAVLHILPLAFIGLCSANLHMEAEGQRVAADRAVIDRAEQMRRDDEEYERDRQRRRAAWSDEIEAEQARKLAEVAAEKQRVIARLECRQARVKFDSSSDAVKASISASQSAPARLSKDERVDTLLTAIRQVGGVSNLDITSIATRLNVSRQTIYNDIKALRDEGRLS